MQTILFFSRLFLYFLLVGTPLFLEPAVVVAYDTVSAIAWFGLAPLQMLLAYYLHPSRLKSKNFWISSFVAVLTVIFFILLFSRMERDAILLYGLLSFFSFTLTRLLFFSKRVPLLASLEIFFFAFVYFSFLSFTRSAPEIAQKSPGLAKSLLFLTLFSFLFHAALIYLAAFPERSFQKKRNELFGLVCILAPLFLFLAFISPSDFVKHEIAFNEWNEEPPPDPKEIEKEGEEGGGGKGSEKDKEGNNRNGLPLGERDEKYPTELQGGSQKQKNIPEKESRPEEDNEGKKKGKGKKQKQKRGEQKRGEQKRGEMDQNRKPDGEQQKGDGGGARSRGSSSGKGKDGPRLEGVPADQWENYNNSQKQGGGKSNKQNAVMVVASRFNPVYAASSYRGVFSEKGLLPLPPEIEPLNTIANVHLIETWRDKVSSRDDKRKIVSSFFLSTIKERVVPYRPYRIQPTVQNVIYHPFDLSYSVQSRVSVSQPNDWFLVRDLNTFEKKRMKIYLEIKVNKQIENVFQKHVRFARRLYLKQKKKKGSIISAEKFFERIDIILRGFARHRYELGFDEEMNLEKIKEFIEKTKKGDCTEFAHASALLGRFMGVPSRVVIGYLASRDLQTPAHKGGLYNLRKRIPLLKDYALKELFLVTTAHHHAWVQFWIPGFGWIDFETTSFAIPPKPKMDPNNMDVVIPLIEEEKIAVTPSFEFPWRLMLWLILFIAFGVINLLYAFNYGRLVYYWFFAKFFFKGDVKGLRALQQLFLMRLAQEGQPLLDRHHTILEYSEQIPEIKEFSELYTMLRFRENYNGVDEKKESLNKIKKIYKEKVKKLSRKGPLGLLRRIVSLRALRY